MNATIKVRYLLEKNIFWILFTTLRDHIFMNINILGMKLNYDELWNVFFRFQFQQAQFKQRLFQFCAYFVKSVRFRRTPL